MKTYYEQYSELQDNVLADIERQCARLKKHLRKEDEESLDFFSYKVADTFELTEITKRATFKTDLHDEELSIREMVNDGELLLADVIGLLEELEEINSKK